MEQKKKTVMTCTSVYNIPLYCFKHVFALEKSVQPGKRTELPAPPVTAVLLSGMLHIESKVLKRFQSIQNKIKMECSFDFFFFMQIYHNALNYFLNGYVSITVKIKSE